MVLPSVVFPQPVSPTTPKVSPLFMLKFTLSTAFMAIFFFLKNEPE